MVHFMFVFSLLILGSTLAIESNFYREESCTNASGYCVLESECHHPVKAQHKNLCAGQKTKGAVCCTGFPVEQVNCFQQHNSCQENCPASLTRGRKGCAAGQVCCVLVR